MNKTTTHKTYHHHQHHTHPQAYYSTDYNLLPTSLHSEQYNVYIATLDIQQRSSCRNSWLTGMPTTDFSQHVQTIDAHNVNNVEHHHKLRRAACIKARSSMTEFKLILFGWRSMQMVPAMVRNHVQSPSWWSQMQLLDLQQLVFYQMKLLRALSRPWKEHGSDILEPCELFRLMNTDLGLVTPWRTGHPNKPSNWWSHLDKPTNDWPSSNGGIMSSVGLWNFSWWNRAIVPPMASSKQSTMSCHKWIGCPMFKGIAHCNGP